MSLFKGLSMAYLPFFFTIYSGITIAGNSASDKWPSDTIFLNETSSPYTIRVPSEVNTMVFSINSISLAIEPQETDEITIEFNDDAESIKLLFENDRFGFFEDTTKESKPMSVHLKWFSGVPTFLAEVEKFPRGITEKNFRKMGSTSFTYKLPDYVREEDFIRHMEESNYQYHIIGTLGFKKTLQMSGVVYTNKLWQGDITAGALQLGGTIYEAGTKIREGKVYDPNAPSHKENHKITEATIKIPSKTYQKLKIFGEQTAKISIKGVETTKAVIETSENSEVIILASNLKKVDARSTGQSKITLKRDAQKCTTIEEAKCKTKEKGHISIKNFNIKTLNTDGNVTTPGCPILIKNCSEDCSFNLNFHH